MGKNQPQATKAKKKESGKKKNNYGKTHLNKY